MSKNNIFSQNKKILFFEDTTLESTEINVKTKTHIVLKSYTSIYYNAMDQNMKNLQFVAEGSVTYGNSLSVRNAPFFFLCIHFSSFSPKNSVFPLRKYVELDN